MSWSNTYTHTVIITVDVLGASLFWNRSDLTISSLCGLELRKKAAGQGSVWSLVQLGRFLNWINTGHCEAAINADAQRAVNALRSLGAKYTIDVKVVI